jgi:hypothetical protein
MVVDDDSIFYVDVFGNMKSMPKAGGNPMTIVDASASGLTNVVVVALAVDSGFVYWTDHTGGTIRKAPRSGGDATILVTAQGGPSSIAVDSDAVYWTNDDDGTVRRLSK